MNCATEIAGFNGFMSPVVLARVYFWSHFKLLQRRKMRDEVPQKSVYLRDQFQGRLKDDAQVRQPSSNERFGENRVDAIGSRLKNQPKIGVPRKGLKSLSQSGFAVRS